MNAHRMNEAPLYMLMAFCFLTMTVCSSMIERDERGVPLDRTKLAALAAERAAAKADAPPTSALNILAAVAAVLIAAAYLIWQCTGFDVDIKVRVKQTKPADAAAGAPPAARAAAAAADRDEDELRAARAGAAVDDNDRAGAAADDGDGRRADDAAAVGGGERPLSTQRESTAPLYVDVAAARRTRVVTAARLLDAEARGGSVCVCEAARPRGAPLRRGVGACVCVRGGAIARRPSRRGAGAFV